MFSFKRLVRSFYYASKGLWRVIKEEQNFRIQIFIALIVLVLAIYFKIMAWQAVALILAIIIVLVLELINSIFERLIDILKPRVHPYVKTIKDIMAATVLIASLGSLVIGVVIFWSYIFG